MPIVILCQGQQTRLRGWVASRKQLLEVAGEPILARTIRLCREIVPGFDIITVGWPDFPPEYNVLTIPDPGHCVLDGIRWLMERLYPASVHTIFLLGDVVFSRAALTKILATRIFPVFALTKDLGRATGEIFSFATSVDSRQLTSDALRTASCKDIDTGGKYQPGHLRNLLFRMMEIRGLRPDRGPGEYHSSLAIEIDDYTDDVDTKADMERLPELSKLVLAEAANPSF